MAVRCIQFAQFRIHAEAEGSEPGICFQGDRPVRVHVVAGAENISAGEHIAGQILQQADGPGRRLFLISAFQPESQLKSVAAFIRIIASFFI